MYPRSLASTITSISSSFPIILITGPRQVGKTTLLQMCSDDKRGYVTLDNLEARYLAQNDPALFIETYPAPVTIDEVQYAPGLFTYLKISVDTKKKNGMYWLTGSQKFELMKGITESLAGRVAILDLLGLSYSEQLQLTGTMPFIPTPRWLKHSAHTEREQKTALATYKRIWQGSFPRVLKANSQTRDIFYRSYIQTYIQRDVQDILNITHNLTFFKFVSALAARTGQQLNYNALSNEIGIDSKTAKSWLSILQTSGLVYLLQPYSSNLNKRIVKSPKIYFLDTGLCAHLTKWSDHKALEAGIMSGAILETYLFSEILKSYWHHGRSPNLYYYRDNDQKEVDLIIDQDNTIYPIEFKKTATPSLGAAKSFPVLKKLGRIVGHGAVICFVPKITALSPDVTAIPIDFI